MALPKITILAVAQSLVVGALVSLTVSPPFVNLFEFSAFFLVIFTPSLRQRFLRFMMTPPGLWLLAFMVLLSAGLIYGIAPKNVVLQGLYSWRRLLLLPIAASLFMDSDTAKRRAAKTYFIACAVLVVYSYCSYFLPWQLYGVSERGIIVRNHATQGMFFTVAVVIGIAMLHNRWLDTKAQRLACLTVLGVLFLNISMLVPGRSGYIALIIMLCSYVLFIKARISRFGNLWVAVATVVLISTTLFLSPVANKKITQAYEEAVHFDKNIYNNVYTSIGVRIMFWRNTLSIIPEHPFIGVGTAGFEQVYAKAVAGQPHLAGLLTNDPHNQYMKFAIEQGLFGLAIFLGLVIAVARQAANEPYRTLGISVLLTWCCTSLGNAHFSTFSEGHFIWIWLGIMLATDSRPRQAALGAARS